MKADLPQTGGSYTRDTKGKLNRREGTKEAPPRAAQKAGETAVETSGEQAAETAGAKGKGD